MSGILYVANSKLVLELFLKYGPYNTFYKGGVPNQMQQRCIEALRLSSCWCPATRFTWVPFFMGRSVSLQLEEFDPHQINILCKIRNFIPFVFHLSLICPAACPTFIWVNFDPKQTKRETFVFALGDLLPNHMIFIIQDLAQKKIEMEKQY